MPSRIDELFSTQRLRRTWNRRTWNQPAGADADIDADGSWAASRRAADGKQDSDSETLPAGPQGITAEFDRLKRLILQRFPGKQGEALDIMLDSLHKLLTVRFPQTEEGPVSEETAVSENEAIPEDVAVSENVAIPENLAIPEDESVSEEEAVSSEHDMTVINQSIEELMNQIEDLVEALEL